MKTINYDYRTLEEIINAFESEGERVIMAQLSRQKSEIFIMN